MKKWIVLLLVSLMLCLTACGGVNENRYSIENFTKLLEAGEYTKAAAMYNATAVGNLQREQEVREALDNFANMAIQSYLSDEMDYEKAKVSVDTVGQVVDSAGMQFLQMPELERKLADANKSKAAYDAGIELLKTENYSAAITEFKKVLETDSRYSAAQERLTAAVKAYREEAMQKAEAYFSAQDYDNAVITISEALRIIPNDTELLTRQTLYTQSHITAVTEQADAAFVNPAEDYGKAADLLKAAMQRYPEDKSLQEKYDYFMSYQPVSIFDMEPYVEHNYGFSTAENETDNMGNSYEKCFRLSKYDSKKSADQVYDIGKKYNCLKGTIAIVYGGGDDEPCMVRIYGDNRLLYELNNISGSTKPTSIEVDITGITDLKVELLRSDNFHSSALFADITLQKTVK